ncbi:MAG: phytanoyl-CoA dioxygenase family protein, partial [Paracoccaceae bacterium]|nr:phytanoyl-CoA dioxygenase family protein [Paracoccaceae bacterium]
MPGIKETFEEQGYYLAKGLFRPDEVAALDKDFDRIVRQLNASGEVVDATWDGGEAEKIAQAGDVILHTHNVQKYSRTWLNAFLNERFLDVVSEIIGDDIVLHHSKLFQKPPENGSP